MRYIHVIALLQNPDIIGIVESCIDRSSSILTSKLTISNYTFICLDHSRHDGGILIYIKDKRVGIGLGPP